jgi:hypothetical protein
MSQKLTWLPTVLLNAGLKVSEVNGWANRGRPGDMADKVWGVVCHHTVGAVSGNMPSLNVLINGHPSLNGPLSQLGLGRDGTYYVIAAGKCNHAGPGSWKGISGNSKVIGIEAENTGYVTDPWPAVQLDAYKRGVAAILNKLGQGSDWCCGHKEWTSGKIDPHSIDMGQFRSDVNSIMSSGIAPSLIPRISPSGSRLTLRRNLYYVQAVEELQEKLGFNDAQVDGYFGVLTEAAVRRFQREHGLVPDGIVGPKTWNKLDSQ